MEIVCSNLISYYSISLTSLVLVLVLECMLPRRKIIKSKYEYLQDLYCYLLVSSVIFLLDFILLPYFKILFGERFVLKNFSNQHIIIQTIIFSLIVDFMYYLSHRFLHYSNTLYQFHRWHHSSHEVTASSGARQHILDFLIGFVIYLPFAMLTNFSKGVYYTYFTIYVFFSFLIHSNFDLKLGPLRYIFQTPNMHIWHHQKTSGKAVNYGFVLSIWDWIFRTSYDKKGIPDQFGFNGEEEYPVSFLRRLLNKN